MSEPDNPSKQCDALSRNEPLSSSAPSIEPESEIKKTPVVAKVIEQSRKFLENDEVKSATSEKKRDFLKHKGLSSEQIESVMKDTDETTISSNAACVSPQEPSLDKTSPETVNTVVKSNLHAPIITYPEFLTNSTPTQAPILTIKSLLTIVYVISLLTTTLHGAHSYANSMLSKLRESRHELFYVVLSKLGTLCSKLGSVVSKKPLIPKKYIGVDNSETKHDETKSEPTELFHRDIGIQTSPPPTQSGSFAIEPSLPNRTPIIHQSEQLAHISSNFRAVSEFLDTEEKSAVELESKISELCSYLNTLAYPLPSRVTMKYANGPDTNELTGGASEFKKEIKGIKGLLLSARSFPAAVGINLEGALKK